MLRKLCAKEIVLYANCYLTRLSSVATEAQESNEGQGDCWNTTGEPVEK